jgi:hypothetical protein
MGSESQPFFRVVAQLGPPTSENILDWLEMRVVAHMGLLKALDGKGH